MTLLLNNPPKKILCDEMVQATERSIGLLGMGSNEKISKNRNSYLQKFFGITGHQCATVGDAAMAIYFPMIRGEISSEVIGELIQLDEWYLGAQKSIIVTP